MRPLRLDITGFAAFRDATTVHFSGADYFVLTGPTGSGKSTVIDALTFALYGSAPRWGRENAIQYALAPTANRCAVRLVFDVAGQRYVAAREVRRSGQQIAQRNARLERYLDPAAGGDPEADEPTESLAGDPRAVRQRVAELLGLDFEDFCTCVVLPQGDFATFLQASVGERQAILLKLLGARHYETIGRLANRRATEANARIDALQGQLASYDDATDAAHSSAVARVRELTDLHTCVTADVVTASTVLERRSRLAVQVDRLSEDLARLDRVRTPDGIAELQRRADGAEQAYRDAGASEREAAHVVQAAEDALAAGPAAAPLEETLRWHSELSRETTRLPVAATAARQASVALDRARRAADDAEQLLDERRRDDEEQRTHQVEVATTVERWTNQLALLRSVVVPDGTAALDQAARRADRAVRECEQQLAAAESAATAARSTRQDLPERSAVTAVQRTIESYATATEQRRQLQERRQELTAQTATAESALATARSSLNRARAEVERLQAQWSAAGLRSHLAVGHECPVCEQRVGVVPDALAVPELDGARAAAAEQEATRQVAEEHAAGLRSRLTGLIAQAGGVDDRLSELDRILQQDLPGQSAGDVRDVEGDRSAAADLLRRLDAAVALQEVADRALEAARAAVRRAQHEVAGIAEQTADSWAALHAARGRLAILDPPSVSGEGLAVAWTALVDWAAGRADGLESTELRAARAALSDADTAAVASGQRLRDATTAARRTSAELTAAVVAEAKATAEHENLLRRVAELEVSLADRPRVDEAERLLSEHRQLALAAEGARGAARAAVRTRQQAEADRDRCRAEREAARSALHRVREPLISMAVPAVDDTDLRRAWAELAEWARVTSRSCRADMVEAQAEHTAVDDELGHRLTRLGALLAEHGVGAAVPSAGDVSTPDGGGRLARIPTEVEIAVERARAATAELGRRRLAAEQLRRQIATETETEQVARQLALMMSAKRFPQWLADAALDSLVADASSSLLQLSGGQFELTHDRGEFFVIDHADADSARSVKTLSGGETFQASLALALALSEQLSTLAAGGRTTLDSIFLDEGFGTLDPDALEIVASTLENLAQGNRMVGVVTHVAALADRVPVRFQVSRDSRTSTIERVGA